MTPEYNIATRLHSLGFSLLPLHGNKRPAVKWKRLQSQRCSEEELFLWFVEYRWRPGIVTGEVSGIVVVDCDDCSGSDSHNFIISQPSRSIVRQDTPRGTHFVFRHPGERIRNATQLHGHKIDIRGDGGYVVAYPDSSDWTNDCISSAPIYENFGG